MHIYIGVLERVSFGAVRHHLRNPVGYHEPPLVPNPCAATAWWWACCSFLGRWGPPSGRCAASAVRRWASTLGGAAGWGGWVPGVAPNRLAQSLVARERARERVHGTGGMAIGLSVGMVAPDPSDVVTVASSLARWVLKAYQTYTLHGLDHTLRSDTARPINLTCPTIPACPPCPRCPTLRCPSGFGVEGWTLVVAALSVGWFLGRGRVHPPSPEVQKPPVVGKAPELSRAASPRTTSSVSTPRGSVAVGSVGDAALLAALAAAETRR